MSKNMTGKGGVVIRIGYMEFYLPDDKGAAQVVKTMSKAVACNGFSIWRGVVEVDKSHTSEVGLTYLPEGIQIVERSHKQEAAA